MGGPGGDELREDVKGETTEVTPPEAGSDEMVGADEEGATVDQEGAPELGALVSLDAG